MKRAEEVMEILEAYDLAGTLRGAAALAGCDHKTVAHWVRQRELAGGIPAAERHRPAVGDFAGKIDELVERSHGRIRGADVAHSKLVALGYQGSERTTRRWVAESKRKWLYRLPAVCIIAAPAASPVGATAYELPAAPLQMRGVHRWEIDGIRTPRRCTYSP